MQTNVDLRYLVESELGAPVHRGTKAWMYRCPFHHEEHGTSLAVYPDGWQCWGKCHKGGDSVEWVRRRHNLSFRDACAYLDVEPDFVSESFGCSDAKKAERPRPTVVTPTPDWQRLAWRLSGLAQTILWKSGERALKYLRGRGLTDETICAAGLGYWPGESGEWRRYGDHHVPCGIVIPWIGAETIWKLQVRRSIGDPKYVMVKGGSLRGLYGVDKLQMGHTALVSEGEFDALLAQQECGDWLSAVTLGASSMFLPDRWRDKLLNCDQVLVACDNDEAGDDAATHLLKDLPNAVRVKLPTGAKDLNELHLQGTGVLRQFLSAYR